jgi:IS5 family transposase
MEASMKRQTLTGFEKYAKTTRRAQFLAEMDRIVPWLALEAVVEPLYPKVSEAGAHRFLWSGCCASTVCSCGSTCRTRR